MSEDLICSDQRSDEWYHDRSGKFTGSRFVDVLSKNKKSYEDLIGQIVVERLTGTFIDSGVDSYSLRWGREQEPAAGDAYQFETGNIIERVGFVRHRVLPFVGVSPDGLIDDRGGVEFKCPKNPLIHLARFYSGMIEAEFMPQVQGCIWTCERDWWDWVSFDPRTLPHLQFYRQRVWRDDAYITKLERAILVAEGEVREKLELYTPEKIELILERQLKQGERIEH